VAQVDAVERDTGQMFARITCKPLSGVDRSQFLLVLGQGAAQAPRPDEPSDSDSPKKGARAKGRRGG
jgi:cell shape-determining protein MreC